MSYQVLARKWRPQNFQQLVGQEHVQRALVNALNDDRLHHAYLFTGTRGVGKTTIARIFAKSLNCETGITSTPCGKCATCVEIAEGRYVDLIEVDAASRTGVDETRELLENVQYAPTRGRYKVYLIDEVHMFSKSSFNALLKTLEEPPPHVKFLLATTDPQKLPVTILSRCLQFNLKRLPVSLIISHLQHILTAENVEHHVVALQLIAEAADGSMRDALSLLDQALAFGGGAVQEQEVRDMLGSVSRDKVIGLLKAVLQRDATQTMKAVAVLAEFSPDFENVLAELLSLLHHMSLAKTVPEALDEFVSNRDILLQLTEDVTAEDLQLFYQIALIGRRDLPLSPDARSGFEMILLRMLAFRPATADASRISQSTAQVNSRSNAHSPTEQHHSSQNKKHAASDKAKTVANSSAPLSSTGGVADADATKSGSIPPAVKSAAIAENAAQLAKPAVVPSAQTVSGDWREIVSVLGLGGLVKQLAINCTMKQRDGNNIVLQIAAGHRNLLNAKAKQRLQQALGEYFNIDAKLDIEVTSQVNSESPAQTIQRETVQRQKQAEQSIIEDSFTQALKDKFNAEIIPGSVKPVNS
ncbi:MAG: DNA polymerase III subunit gamma/tau [Gammaproteobacteria bacterium]|nr:DNA polymerase III subunit gamma/tau [Gammaproteobacteria bacterium]